MSTETATEPKRTCTRCGRSKALEDFHRAIRGPLGRDTKCKECVNNRHRQIKNQEPRGEYGVRGPETRAAFAAEQKQREQEEADYARLMREVAAQMKRDREAVADLPPPPRTDMPGFLIVGGAVVSERPRIKKKKRKSISIRGETYRRFRAWCYERGLACSAAMEMLIAEKLGRLDG